MTNKDELYKLIDENTNIDVINGVYEYINEINKVSTNLIQRKFNLGFNSVYKIISLFEIYGIISPYNHEQRKIIGTLSDLEQLIIDIKEYLNVNLKKE